MQIKKNKLIYKIKKRFIIKNKNKNSPTYKVSPTYIKTQT